MQTTFCASLLLGSSSAAAAAAAAFVPLTSNPVLGASTGSALDMAPGGGGMDSYIRQMQQAATGSAAAPPSPADEANDKTPTTFGYGKVQYDPSQDVFPTFPPDYPTFEEIWDRFQAKKAAGAFDGAYRTERRDDEYDNDEDTDSSTSTCTTKEASDDDSVAIPGVEQYGSKEGADVTISTGSIETKYVPTRTEEDLESELSELRHKIKVTENFVNSKFFPKSYEIDCKRQALSVECLLCDTDTQFMLKKATNFEEKMAAFAIQLSNLKTRESELRGELHDRSIRRRDEGVWQ